MKTSSFKQLSFNGVITYANHSNAEVIHKTNDDQDKFIKDACCEANRFGFQSRRGHSFLVSALTKANLRNGILIKFTKYASDLSLNIDTSDVTKFRASVDFISTGKNLLKFICNA